MAKQKILLHVASLDKMATRVYLGNFARALRLEWNPNRGKGRMKRVPMRTERRVGVLSAVSET